MGKPQVTICMGHLFKKKVRLCQGMKGRVKYTITMFFITKRGRTSKSIQRYHLRQGGMRYE